MAFSIDRVRSPHAILLPSSRCCPRLGSARRPRASGWPALDTAGRPPARTAAHGQDGWLGTGSLHGWSGSGGGCWG
jgi:hypothetical protein